MRKNIDGALWLHMTTHPFEEIVRVKHAMAHVRPIGRVFI